MELDLFLLEQFMILLSEELDALNYATYIDARFILVGTPSGVTLSHEGGAHNQ